jgi:hypothetical protein
VISLEYADDPLVIVMFGMIGKQIADEALSGKPLEMGFTDNNLKPIMAVPLSGLMMFDKSELYYTEPVTRDEAHRVGEILVRQGIFSADRNRTIYIQHVQGKYRLRLVTSPEYVENPLSVIHFGVVGKHIAADVMGGKPIELGLYDAQLKLVNAVPLSALMMFGKGELYYTEPVTRDEAHRVGEVLMRQEIFSTDRNSTAHLQYEQGRYRLQFVIIPEYADDPYTAIQFGMLGRQIADDVLGGKRVEVEFTDNRLKLIKIIPSSALIMFGKGELYFSEPVKAAEADAVGKRLMQSGYFNDDRPVAVYFTHADDAFQLKFVIDPSRATDSEIRSAFADLTRHVVGEALGERPVVLHLCDGNFATLHRERL